MYINKYTFAYTEISISGKIHKKHENGCLRHKELKAETRVRLDTL